MLLDAQVEGLDVSGEVVLVGVVPVALGALDAGLLLVRLTSVLLHGLLGGGDERALAALILLEKETKIVFKS